MWLVFIVLELLEFVQEWKEIDSLGPFSGQREPAAMGLSQIERQRKT